MATPLFPIFKKRVNDAFERIIRDQVIPWSFLMSGPPFHIQKFDGKPIHYEGIKFEGSPRLVFWSRYIEPFLEEVCVSEIGMAVSMAKEKGVDGRLLIPELQQLLLVGCKRVYRQMADVDQRLMRISSRKGVRLKSTENEFRLMSQFIEDHINGELDMWAPKSKFEAWYERNKFLVWAIGLLISIAGLLVNFG